MKNKKIFYTIAGVAIPIIILYYLLRQLVTYWHQVSVWHFSFYYPYLGISILCLLSFFVLSAKGWHLTVRILGGKLSFYRAVSISTYAQFGKYMPGKVWSLVGKTYLGERHGLDREIAIKSILLEFLFANTTGLVLFSLYQFKNPVFPFAILGYIWAGIVVSSLLILHPFLANRFISVLAKMFKYDITPLNFRLKDAMLLFIFYSSLWLLLGLSLFFLIASFFKAPLDLFLPLSCIFPFANTTGTIAVFVPGGLGIREGILSYLLKPMLGVSVSVLFALLSRIWTTIGEVLLFIIVFVVDKKVETYERI